MVKRTFGKNNLKYIQLLQRREHMLPGVKKYLHIFSPIKVGKLEIKNRIKYASTERNFNYRDGYVSDK